MDFHGEMVLLVNYSTLNYTGIFVYLLAVNKGSLVIKDICSLWS